MSYLQQLYQPFVHELSLSKLFGSLLHHWVLEKDISVLRFLYFVIPILSCLNPTLAVLHVPRIPSLWQPLSIPTQFFYWIFNGLFAGNLNIHKALMLILLVTWIGPSFVKTHDLSWLFMEWAFLWNFGPQQCVRKIWSGKFCFPKFQVKCDIANFTS